MSGLARRADALDQRCTRIYVDASVLVGEFL
jgi:hypothetical protein